MPSFWEASPSEKNLGFGKGRVKQILLRGDQEKLLCIIFYGIRTCVCIEGHEGLEDRKDTAQGSLCREKRSIALKPERHTAALSQRGKCPGVFYTYTQSWAISSACMEQHNSAILTEHSHLLLFSRTDEPVLRPVKLRTHFCLRQSFRRAP